MSKRKNEPTQLLTASNLPQCVCAALTGLLGRGGPVITDETVCKTALRIGKRMAAMLDRETQPDITNEGQAE